MCLSKPCISDRVLHQYQDVVGLRECSFRYVVHPVLPPVAEGEAPPAELPLGAEMEALISENKSETEPEPKSKPSPAAKPFKAAKPVPVTVTELLRQAEMTACDTEHSPEKVEEVFALELAPEFKDDVVTPPPGFKDKVVAPLPGFEDEITPLQGFEDDYDHCVKA